jgi:hypothetical protein
VRQDPLPAKRRPSTRCARAERAASRLLRPSSVDGRKRPRTTRGGGSLSAACPRAAARRCYRESAAAGHHAARSQAHGFLPRETPARLGRRGAARRCAALRGASVPPPRSPSPLAGAESPSAQRRRRRGLHHFVSTTRYNRSALRRQAATLAAPSGGSAARRGAREPPPPRRTPPRVRRGGGIQRTRSNDDQFSFHAAHHLRGRSRLRRGVFACGAPRTRPAPGRRERPLAAAPSSGSGARQPGPRRR